MSEDWQLNIGLEFPLKLQRAFEDKPIDVIWNLSSIDQKLLMLNAGQLRIALLYIASDDSLRNKYNITAVSTKRGSATSFIHNTTFNSIDFDGKNLSKISFQLNTNPEDVGYES